jgi:hypothetical protein
MRTTTTKSEWAPSQSLSSVGTATATATATTSVNEDSRPSRLESSSIFFFFDFLKLY